MPWQYEWDEVLLSNRDEAQEFVANLENRGNDGWELAQLVPIPRSPNSYWVILKRQT